MQKHLKLVTTAVVMVCLAGPLSAQDQSASPDVTIDTVIATVNGVEITLGHMIAARATLPQQYQQLDDKVLYDGILEQLVQQSALAQSYEAELPARVTKSLENERRSLIAAEAIESILTDAITEEELQELYNQQFGDIDPEEEYNAAHILVETEAEALAIKEEIEGGADFAATAREKSTGPSGPNGGALGWFGTGMMVPSFESATIALEVGEVSAPVQTQFGWHIIKLNEVRSADIPTLEDVRDDLTAQLSQQIAQQAIKDAADNADVQLPAGLDIDPALLKQTELLD